MRNYVGVESVVPVLNQPVYHFDKKKLTITEYRIVGIKYTCNADRDSDVNLIVTDEKGKTQEVAFGRLGGFDNGKVSPLGQIHWHSNVESVYASNGSLGRIVCNALDTNAVLKEIKRKYNFNVEIGWGVISPCSGGFYCLVDGKLKRFNPLREYTLTYDADGYHIDLDFPEQVRKEDMFNTEGDYLRTLNIKTIPFNDEVFNKQVK